MKICTRDAFASHQYTKEYSYRLEAETVQDICSLGQTPFVDVTATVSSNSGVVTCEMHIQANFQVACSRCLKQFEYPFDVTVKKIVCDKDEGGYDDVIYVDGGYFFDLSEEVRTQIYFEFPMKPLCDSDCKGLCPVCGCDLNTQTCSCDIRTTDPRLAVLKKLIDK